jgi:hypothetical protein
MSLGFVRDVVDLESALVVGRLLHCLDRRDVGFLDAQLVGELLVARVAAEFKT